MLRTKFKNLRWPARADRPGLTDPPLKKVKRIPCSALASFTDSDVAEYKRHIEYWKQTYNSKKWSLSVMKILLEQTSRQRRSWIKNESPSVKMVLKNFPCLADPRIVGFMQCLLMYMYIHMIVWVAVFVWVCLCLHVYNMFFACVSVS